MTKEKLNKLKSETHAELINNILPFWGTKMIDHKRGGFFGQIDGIGNVFPEAGKGCILNARILWTFSAAYRVLQNSEYLKLATIAKDYLLDYFFDEEYNGFFWLIDCNRKMIDGKKQIYAQAFVIYALAEYYRITQDETCLVKAIDTFLLIEQYSYDNNMGGYFEAFSREWGQLDDLRLSERDANEKKTMNTHLHVLEAYTNLYRIWKNKELKQQLYNLIGIFTDKILNQKTFHLNLFFDENWNCKSDIISYGHDIECSWLLYEAASILEDKALINTVKDACLKIAEKSGEGLVANGGLVYEKVNNEHVDTDRHWWVQAEAMVGFFNAFELSGNNDFLNKTLAVWDFISNYLVDKEHGEWFWSVDVNLKPNTKDYKAGFWKCPYHNSRACLELIERIEE
jgi:cellobiose epimerase